MQDLVPGNRVTLLESGADYFPALLGAFDGARAEISLETYLFEDDDTGRQVAQALARAAGRGVRVRVMVDGFGAPHFRARFMPGLEAAGVRAMVYRPFHFFPAWSRLHRKVAVVDGALQGGAAFVGGINVIGDATGQADPSARRLDYAVRVEGPLASVIREDARSLWNRAAWFRGRRHFVVPRGHAAAPEAFPDGVPAAFVIRNNIRHRREIEKAYLAAIHGAHRDITLANAYFLPSLRFRRALAAAALRGVKVTVLLQGRTDHWLAHYASHELYASLLVPGVRLFAYDRTLLHAKAAVVDGRWATVGSSNIDILSMTLAREANVVVRDPALAAKLHASLEEAIQGGAREIRMEDLRQSPWRLRLLRLLAYGFVRLLAGLAGWH